VDGTDADFDVGFGRESSMPLAHRLEKMNDRFRGCVARLASFLESDEKVRHPGRGDGSARFGVEKHAFQLAI
jgi:hypothetical protein